MPEYIVELIEDVHRDKPVILINCSYNSAIDAAVRSIPGRTWSNSRRCWYIQRDERARDLLEQKLGRMAILKFIGPDGERLVRPPSSFAPEERPAKIMMPAVLDPEKENKALLFGDWLRSKRYSGNTIGTYVDALRVLMINRFPRLTTRI